MSVLCCGEAIRTSLNSADNTQYLKEIMMSTKQQIATLAGALVTHQGEFTHLTKHDRQWIITNPKAAIKLLEDALERALLELVEEINMSSVSGFNAGEIFRTDNKTEGVLFHNIDHSFREIAKSRGVEHVQATILKVHSLCRIGLDKQIRPLLRDGGVISLAHYFEILKYKAKKGDFSPFRVYIQGGCGVWTLESKKNNEETEPGWDISAGVTIIFRPTRDVGSKIVSY